MIDIKTFLDKRETLFNNQTKIIFEHLAPILSGIKEFLSEADTSYAPGDFNWVDVAIDNETLQLIGFVTYKPGVSFLLDGDIIEITENNKDYFIRPLRFGISLEVVAQYDKDVVVDFLNGLRDDMEAEEIKHAMATEAEEIIRANEPSEPEIQLIPDPTATDFNLDELTEEQRKAFMQQGTGKIN